MNTVRYGIVVLTAAYAVIGGACVFVPVGTNLRVTITSDRLVNEGMATTLTASAEGGSPPFLFRWSQERGPVDLVLTDIMSDTLVTEPLTTQGDYVFRVVVTDAHGDTADTFAPVRVVDPDVPLGEPVVLVDGPATAEFGAGVLLSAQTNLLNAEFAWEVVSGAADIDTPTDDATTVTPTALGTLVVRVTATEVATAESVAADATIEVSPSINIVAPVLAVVGEPVPLTVTVAPSPVGVSFGWSVEAGQATLDGATQQSPTLTTEARDPVRVLLTVTAPTDGDFPAASTREVEIASVFDLKPEVRVSTNLGDFTLRLEGVRAPQLTANFLLRVDDGFYDDMLLHRVTPFSPLIGVSDPPQVIQGGAYIRDDVGDLVLKEPTRDPASADTDIGLSNGIINSVTMALESPGGIQPDLDSVGAEFLINRSPLNQFLDLGAFPVFARVSDGEDVVDAISAVEVIDSPIFSDADGNAELSLPAEDIVMQSVRRLPIAAPDEENPFVAVQAPPLAVIGEPTPLVANVQPLGAGVATAWVVVSGTASFDDDVSATPTLTTTLPETVVVELTVVAPTASGTPNVITRQAEIVSVENLNPQILFETSVGDFTFELSGDAAPRTTANILLYVDDGFYDGTLIHRVASDPLTGEPFVIQGGGFVPTGDVPEEREVTRDPIPSESGNGLTNGLVNTVAMALSSGDPDSATAQWFINRNAGNGDLLDPLEFTVFAVVVDGLSVLDAIESVEVTDNPLIAGETSAPVVDIVVIHATRVAP